MKFTVTRASRTWADPEHPPCPNAVFEPMAQDGKRSDNCWTIEITSLDELMAIVKETTHNIIVGERDFARVRPEIMIYDDYVE